jgi:hypothetical protein
MHLDLGRREDFRKARSQLLQSCGPQTHEVIEIKERAESAQGSKTALQNQEGRLPPGVEFGLMDQEAIYPLRIGVNTVGRLPDNSVVIEDPHVSRRHCAVLIHAGDGGELHDVASKNGTYLNGRRIDHPTPLRTGDEIRMCDCRLIFVAKRSSPSSSAPAPGPTQADDL